MKCNKQFVESTCLYLLLHAIGVKEAPRHFGFRATLVACFAISPLAITTRNCSCSLKEPKYCNMRNEWPSGLNKESNFVAILWQVSRAAAIPLKWLRGVLAVHNTSVEQSFDCFLSVEESNALYTEIGFLRYSCHRCYTIASPRTGYKASKLTL